MISESAFRWLAVALLVLMAALMVEASIGDTQTWDEGIHLTAGYTFLSTGAQGIYGDHPPLIRAIAALPLLLLDPHLPLEEPTWNRSNQPDFAPSFLYHNRIPAGAMLFPGRSMMMLLTLALGLSMALWSRRHFGNTAGLLVLFLFCLDPNFIAHGHYVTTDLGSALFFFLPCICWHRYLVRRRRIDLMWSGLALGAGFLSKFSLVILLPPLFVLLYLLYWRHERRGSTAHFLGSTAAVLMLAALGVIAVYGANIGTLRSVHAIQGWFGHAGPPAPLLAETLDDANPTGRKLLFAARTLALPGHPYLKGLFAVLEHSGQGHATYLLVRRSSQGRWYYFPVVFAVKTPLAVLLLCLVALWATAWHRRPGRIGFEWTILAVPLVVYFGASMLNGINLGMRHLLPVYPFLLILISAALVRLMERSPRPVLALLAAAVLLQVLEVVCIRPYYASFFNLAAGGPAHGEKYLLDSNLDWGQDLLRLKKYLDQVKPAAACIAYFGNADLSYYDVYAAPIPTGADPPSDKSKLNCLAVISVTLLHDLYVDDGAYAWLRSRKPDDRVGYSLHIYRQDRPPDLVR